MVEEVRFELGNSLKSVCYVSGVGQVLRVNSSFFPCFKGIVLS